MSRSQVSKAFNASTSTALKTTTKGKRPAPFSLRLSAEERACLEGKAGSRPLGAYIRGKLLEGIEACPRKAGRAPTVDYAALGQVLGLLGKSQQIQCLFLLALAEKKKCLSLPKEESAALRTACADIRIMRRELVKALGLKSGGAP